MTQAISILLLIFRSLFTFIVYPPLEAVDGIPSEWMCSRFIFLLFIFIILGCFSILVFISAKVLHFFDLTFLDTHYYHNRINRLKKYTHTANKKFFFLINKRIPKMKWTIQIKNEDGQKNENNRQRRQQKLIRISTYFKVFRFSYSYSYIEHLEVNMESEENRRQSERGVEGDKECKQLTREPKIKTEDAENEASKKCIKMKILGQSYNTIYTIDISNWQGECVCLCECRDCGALNHTLPRSKRKQNNAIGMKDFECL